jgi:ABC-type glycerol-3-phosphate transport system permease component
MRCTIETTVAFEMFRATKMNGAVMESLALLVSIMLLVIFGAGFTAFGLSWFRSRGARIATYVFASFSILSGVWLAVVLIDGNGLAVGFLPVALGVFSIFNTRRKAKAKPKA